MKLQPTFLIHHFKTLLKFVVIAQLFTFGSTQAGSYDDFFQAIKRDDNGTIQQLLQRGFDANTPDPQGQPGLMIALREPAPKVANVLVAWPGTNLNILTAKDESPLMLAAIKGQLDLAKQLIAKDAAVNKTGWTPLHYAATAGDVKMISLLLEHYAFIDAQSPNGTTPLMMAAMYGTPPAVKLLLDEGADTSMKNQQGMTAIQFAQKANHLDIAEMVGKHVRAKRPAGTW